MEEKGFFAALFDFSFSSLITLKIVRLLYVLALGGAGIWTLIILAAAFSDSSTAGVVVLILSPVIFLVFAIVVRVYLEMTIVLFKIADNTAAMATSMVEAPRSAPPQPTEERRTD